MSDKLVLKGISKTFTGEKGSQIAALQSIDLTIKDQEFVSMVGPSGCGKSTLIYLIAGFDQPSGGEIYVNGKRVQSPGSDRGVVFQKVTSFPWLTVLENIGFGLKILGVGDEERRKLSMEYLELTGLRGFENEYPAGLSGGMQQRVALARSLVTNPEILLMDEPFAALDSQTRRFMQDLLVDIWEKTRKTILFVTHDVDEALLIADRVLVMSSRPGIIMDDIKVDLPRPRTFKVEFSQEYIELKKRVQNQINSEAMKTLSDPDARLIERHYQETDGAGE